MSSMKQAAAEGACLTCLDQGTVKFPLDPYAHCVITTARELIRNMSHPLFYLAEISHDLR